MWQAHARSAHRHTAEAVGWLSTRTKQQKKTERTSLTEAAIIRYKEICQIGGKHVNKITVAPKNLQF